MSGTDIFISYAREERAAARHFAESFATEGFKVWWDAVLRSGETFDEVIEKELRAAKAVVVLWSPRSVASRWVRAEATLADRGNKLVPVIIEACNLPIIFELTHAADLANWTGDTSDPRWQTLVSDLRRLVGDRVEDVPAPPKPVEPVAKVEPEPVAPEPPAPVKQEESKPASTTHDELMQALERLSRSRATPLAKPTPTEQEKTEFFKWADEYRLKEGEEVHCLRKLDADEDDGLFLVTPAGLRVGRTPPADIIVPGAAVSRAHCLVELAGDRLRVTDLNSTNGTFIDNKRIERSAILEVGAVLRVGNASFEHELRSRSEVERPARPAGIDRKPDSPEPRIARGS